MPLGHPLIFPIIIYHIFNNIESHLTIKGKKKQFYLFLVYTYQKKKKKKIIFHIVFIFIC